MATYPGVRTTLFDRMYNQARTDLPGGPGIAIIAKRLTTSSNTVAPDFTPYFAVSELDVITQFGQDSQLHRAYYEVTTAGATNITLIPLPSNTTFDQTNGVLASATYPTIDPFEAAFDAVESARVDIVVPWGRGSDTTDWDDFATPVATPGNNTSDYFYADNSATAGQSWAKRVADKCQTITINTNPILAVMGVKPIAGTQIPTTAQIIAGFNLPNLISRETLNSGAFLNVVVSEMIAISTPTAWGWSNGACAYAAMIARLDAWRATTMKPVYNVDRLRYNLTRTQATTLIGLGVVPVQLDFQRRPRWVDGVTFSKSASDYTRLSTLRIVFDAVDVVRNISQNYIGEGMSIQMRNAFETQISAALRSMHQLQAINHSDFRVQYSPSQNQALVDLAIVPAFELREVVVSVAVNF